MISQHFTPCEGWGLAIIDSSGASDGGQIIMVGGKPNFAGIVQQAKLIGDSVYIGFNVLNYLGAESPENTVLEFRLQMQAVPGSSGEIIYRHVVDMTSDSWEEVSISTVKPLKS